LMCNHDIPHFGQIRRHGSFLGIPRSTDLFFFGCVSVRTGLLRTRSQARKSRRWRKISDGSYAATILEGVAEIMACTR
jgi:hypothetical protein